MNFAATHRALTQAVTWAGQRFGDDVFRIAPSLVEARASAPTEAFAVSAAKFRRCSYYGSRSPFIQSLPEHFLENLHPHWLIPVAQLSSLFVPQKEKNAQILGLSRAKCSRGKSAGGCKSHAGSKSLFSCPARFSTIWTMVSLPQVLRAPLTCFLARSSRVLIEGRRSRSVPVLDRQVFVFWRGGFGRGAQRPPNEGER